MAKPRTWIGVLPPLIALAPLVLMGGSGCGGSSVPPATDAPRFDATVKAVQAGQERPRKVRTLVKHKLTSNDQEKTVPRDVPGTKGKIR
jgi:hypothetical protein